AHLHLAARDPRRPARRRAPADRGRARRGPAAPRPLAASRRRGGARLVHDRLPGHLRPRARRPFRAPLHGLQVPLDGPPRRPHPQTLARGLPALRRRELQAPRGGGPPHHAARSDSPPHEHRRAAPALERPPRRHEPHRPASRRPGGAGGVRRLRTPAAAGPAGAHGGMAGGRPEPDQLPRAGPDRSQLRRHPLLARRRPDPPPHRSPGPPQTRGRLMRAGGARWPLAVVCLYAALVPFQPVFTLADGSPLRLAAADAVAPLVLLAAVAHPRRRLPFAPTALMLAIPSLALVTTVWAAVGRSLSLYALGKTAGLLYLATIALAIVRATDRDAAPAILRALARGTFWS